MAVERGTSGKNSETDQRQLQATSQEGSVVGGDGNINEGTSISTQGDVNLTDQGAVNSAFGFGANVVAEVGKVFANASANQKETVAANTAGLQSIAGLINANSAGGAAESQNKTVLYIAAAALAAVALIFIFRR